MNEVWANVYANLIRNTEITGKTIDDVPLALRERVLELLNEGN